MTCHYHRCLAATLGLVILLALPTPAMAQTMPLVVTAEAQWLATPDPDSRGQFQGAAALADGGALLVGRTGGGNTRAWAVRVDPAGQVLWSRAYGDGADDYFEAAAALPDGRMIAVGRTRSGGTDALAIALNPDGSVAWQQSYGGSSMDLFQDVHVTADGRIFAVGSYTLWHADRRDGWVAELDPDDGDVIADDTWGEQQSDIDETDLIYGVAPLASDPAGRSRGMVMVGASDEASGRRSGAIVDLDADGEVLRGDLVTSPSGSRDDTLRAVLALDDGRVVAVGQNGSARDGEQVGWLVVRGADGQTRAEGIRQAHTTRFRGVAFAPGTADGGNGPVPDGLWVAGETREPGAGSTALLMWIDLTERGGGYRGQAVAVPDGEGAAVEALVDMGDGRLLMAGHRRQRGWATLLHMDRRR